MRNENVEYFYPDQPLFVRYGLKCNFAIVVRLSKNVFMLKSYKDGWLRNDIKKRFSSYEEAVIYGTLIGVDVKSKKDFFHSEESSGVFDLI